MTTEAHEVTTADELRHLFVGGVGGGHVSPRCFVDTWSCEGTPNNWATNIDQLHLHFVRCWQKNSDPPMKHESLHKLKVLCQSV